MANTKLTTVKILTDVYSKFKKISFDSNITLKLVNRSINKYVEEEEFKSEINEYTATSKWFTILIMNKQNNGNEQPKSNSY